MIRYVERKVLDIEKYNACIDNAVQNNVAGFSWYLDIVTTHWDVLVLDDYKAVMPIPWKKKYGIKYVTTPFWVLQLGVFSESASIEITPFLAHLFSKYSFVNLRMNTENNVLIGDETQQNQCQVLQLDSVYSNIYKHYRKDRKKELVKAEKSFFKEDWEAAPEKLIALFQENIGSRIKNIRKKDYTILLQLLQICIAKNKGKLLAVYDEDTRLIAAGFFLTQQGTTTILLSATDVKNRKRGAASFLIDRAISACNKKATVFNFGGSSIQGIADYNTSFGATTKEYTVLKHNRLPGVLRFFKQA